jgi:hypothetical protein
VYRTNFRYLDLSQVSIKCVERYINVCHRTDEQREDGWWNLTDAKADKEMRECSRI